ncbi:DUF2190 family protein [Variovorax paradoxus]|uniref:DUF2190 domain-containing protein n=1 Tax=Variovorax paradoxus TaxID=34073 RepID=A0A0H2M1V0_VARPD|nr:DUF2190 family protein [Variovorax paradoxus]KLN54722.1 hypothetical protein VPARA_40260 [Variovorax paradoxus]
MGISSLFRGRVAEAAIAAHLILKGGVGAMSCVVAAAATDKLLGTSDELDHVTGEMVDMSVSPIASVRLGGTVVAGDPLTSDANGKAIATTTTGNRIIGFAEVGGVLNDVITYLRAPGVI